MAEAGSFPRSNRALWAAIARMHIYDRADGRSFEAALCERTGWPTPFARRAVAEYRRFLFLAATSAAELTPSRAVDEVWHLHLEYGSHYREQLCGHILGRMLDHRPGSGAAADERRFRSQYEATLRFYADVFADPPPEDVWPRSAVAVEAAPRRPRNGRRVVFGLGAGIAAAAVTAAAPSAAGVALAGLAAVLVAITLSPPPRRRRDGPAGDCGGQCAGVDDGGAGCGGGGCGGGCGG